MVCIEYGTSCDDLHCGMHTKVNHIKMSGNKLNDIFDKRGFIPIGFWTSLSRFGHAQRLTWTHR